MLRILEAKDVSAYETLLSQLPQGVHVSEAIENDGVKGFIIYDYEPEQVVIYAVDDGQDYNYCDGLVRSVLFKAELKGIERAEFRMDDENMLTRLRTLHFVNNHENTLENIADIMENCKKCKENTANT